MGQAVLTNAKRGNNGAGVAADDVSARELVALASALTDRMALARALGQKAYGGDRDYDQVLGYPSALSAVDYLSRYHRQDIAHRIVDLPADDTWKKPPQVSENGDTNTAFVKEWNALAERLRVFSVLSRVDRISGIGRYGALYIGFRDGSEHASEPAIADALSSQGDVLFLRPFSELSASIKETERDRQSERFGQPTLYELEIEDLDKLAVHWSRVLHVADNKLDSDVYGVPRLQLVFNRLDDLLKIVGGSAEATWLNMRPGTLLTTQEGYEFKSDDESKRKVEQEIAEYLHGLARIMTIEGVDIKTLLGQVIDPRGPFDVQIALISAASGIPQRVLLGSAAGQLAAAQEDMRQWYGHIAHRQTAYAEPDILRPLIDRLISFGVLPEPASGSYNIGEQDDNGNWSWPPLFELSDSEQARVSLTRAQTAKALQDPVTLELPLDLSERRMLMGLRPEPDDLQAQIARTITANLQRGAIERSTYTDWLIAEAQANGVI